MNPEQNENIADLANKLASILSDDEYTAAHAIENRAEELISFNKCENFQLAAFLHQIAISHRGIPGDYANLGYCLLSWGIYGDNVEEAVTKYRLAYDNYIIAIRHHEEKKGEFLDRNEEALAHGNLAVSISKLANYDTSLTVEQRISLNEEAIKYCIKGIRLFRIVGSECRIKLGHSYRNLGYTYLSLGSLLQLEMKKLKYRKSIRYHKKAVGIENKGDWLYNLADSQLALLELAPIDPDLAEPAKKESLKAEVIANYTRSYKQDGDAGTLKRIEYVKQLQI